MNALFATQSALIALALILFVVGLFRRFETPTQPDRLIMTAIALAVFASCFSLVQHLPFWSSILAFALIGLGAGVAIFLRRHGSFLPSSPPRLWALVSACLGFMLALCAAVALLQGYASGPGLRLVGLITLVLCLDMSAYGLWLMRARASRSGPWSHTVFAIVGIIWILCLFWAFALTGALSLIALILSTLVLAAVFLRGRGEQDLAPAGLLLTASFGVVALGFGLIDGTASLVFLGAFFAVASLCFLPRLLSSQNRSVMQFLIRG